MKVCERCQKQFSCEAQTGACWCMDFTRAKDIPKEFQDCLCPDCLREFSQPLKKNKELVEGEDFYYNEQGLFVFTAKYLLDRGYCCGNGCKHCPY